MAIATQPVKVPELCGDDWNASLFLRQLLEADIIMVVR